MRPKFLLIGLFLGLAYIAQGFDLAQAKYTIDSGLVRISKEDLVRGPVILEGKAGFVWNQLLEQSTDDAQEYISMPGLWSEQSYKNRLMPAQGFGTYFFKILLPDSTAMRGQELAFGLPHSYCAYKFLVNGQVFAVNGTVAVDAEDYEPYWKPQVVTFVPNSDTLNVTLQVANFSHTKGGIREPILLGGSRDVQFQFNRDMAFDYILTGCLLMGGLFFLGFYLFGRNDNALLLFSLFCIVYAYRIIGAKNYGLHYLLPEMPWDLAIKLEYITLYLSVTIFIGYSYLLYTKQFGKRVFYVAFTISASFFLVSLVTNPLFYTGLLNAYFIVLLISTLYILYVYTAAYRDNNQGAIFAILSMAALAFSFTYDIVAYFDIIEKNNLIIFISYLAFFFLQSLILSNRFAKTYQNVLKKSLEARVAKIDFLSTVSHEIRTPLNAIIGMSNLLKVEGEQKENLSTLRLSAQNLLMLINDILDFTKISAGKFEIEEKPTDLYFLLNNLLRGFRLKNTHADTLKIILDIDDATPRHILCDSLRLSQVLNNLISNAIKFTDHGYVKVTVRCLQHNTDQVKLQFDVEDTGIGIPADKFEEIFETFTQLNTSTTRQHGGIGLGLSISKKLLELQGSNISLTSKLGEGSIFKFVISFNLPSESQILAIDQAKIIEGEGLVGTKILVVEDNDMNILVTKKFLQKWKVSFDIAKNGRDAINMYNDHDLILMDLQMPVMDGYQASKELRKQGVKVPIIALTASALLDIREKIFSSGMDDYIIKPFDPDDLYLKLNAHIKDNKKKV